MNLPSSSTIMHVGEACDVAVVARIAALVFTIDICNSFCHTYEKFSEGQMLHND